MVRVPTGKGLDSLNFSTGTSGWSPKAFSLSCSDMGGMERGRIGHERCQESKSKMQLKSDCLFHEAILEAVCCICYHIVAYFTCLPFTR